MRLDEKKMSELIVAGIVTFNPVKERLINNVEAVLTQVENVIIVDNCSENRSDISAVLLSRYCERIVWIQNDKNYGIAYALNLIFERAQKSGYEWVLTLDQDTVIPRGLLKAYQEKFNDRNVAQLACNIFEHNTNKFIYHNKDRFTEINRCITSGTVTNISAWEKVGGYDEYLFIDYVDYDFSMKLHKLGYTLIRCNEVFIEHELGESKVRKFLFLSVRVSNYSAKRKYYIARNIIIYTKRYCNIITGLKELLRLMRVGCFLLLYEEGKSEKFHAMVKGIKDGLRFDENKKSESE